MVNTPLPAAAIADKLILLNQHCAPLSLRQQASKDLPWVEALHAKAFGPGRFARTAFRVREKLGIENSLCLIALLNGERVGTVWMTPISLSQTKGYLLGPLATDSDFHNLGIGKLLVKTVTKLALENLPKGFVLLVGDASYYAPLGFEVVGSNLIVFPGPVDPKRILISSQQPTHVKDLSGIIAKP